MAELEELFTRYAVKVDNGIKNGSGCLFQPNTGEFTYVLTAKHCIQDEKDNISEPGQITVCRDDKISSKEQIEVIGVYYHEDEDAAILTVKRIEDFKDIRLQFTFCEEDDIVRFFGYPEIKKNLKIKSDVVKCEFLRKMDNRSIEITTNQVQFTNEVSVFEALGGFSGSGVFKKNKKNNDIFLVGILSRLSIPGGVGGKITVLSMGCFVDIVAHYKEKLKPLTPEHLNSYEEYKEKIWVGYSRLPLQHEVLRYFAGEVIKKGVTPLILYNHFQEKFLFPRNCNVMDWINETSLWTGWLEFLTYNKIIKEKTKSKELELALELLGDNYFFYNNEVEDWIELINKKIFRELDRREVKRGTCIVINTKYKDILPITKMKVNIKSIVPSIGNVQNVDHIDQGLKPIRRYPEKEKQNIDSTKGYTFLHLQEFKKKFIDNKRLQELGGIDPADAGTDEKKKITEEFKKSINSGFEQ